MKLCLLVMFALLLGTAFDKAMPANGIMIIVRAPTIPAATGSALLVNNTDAVLLVNNVDPACLAGGC